MDFKRLWVVNKPHYTIEQGIQIEKWFRLAAKFEVCWICGQTNNLNHVRFKNFEGEVVEGIHCGKDIKAGRERFNTDYLKTTKIVLDEN